MQRNRSPRFKRVAGLLLMIAGFSVILFGIRFVIQLGLLGGLMFGWSLALLFGVAGFLLVDLGLRRSARAILLGFGIMIPWSLILLIQLPDELQLWLALSVALVGVLFYKRYQTRKSRKMAHVEGIDEKQKRTEPEDVRITVIQRQNSVKRFTLRKAFGVILLVAGVFCFLVAALTTSVFPVLWTWFLMMPTSFFICLAAYFISSYTLRKAFGVLLLISGFFWFLVSALTIFVFPLLWMWILMMPSTLALSLSAHFIYNRRLKLVIQAWISLQFMLWLVPLFVFIFLLPLVYEILSLLILGIAFVSFLYWYRRRGLAERLNQAINPT
jgi:hypothetical protein